jgi:general secretion pathway protein K
MKKRPATGNGFALVTVLWTVMIVGLIAAAVMATTRSDATQARTRRRAAELRAVADAGIEIAILRLLDAGGTLRPPLDGTPFAVTFDGLAMEARVQDEGGKIDLNAAPAPLLRKLLQSAGLDEDAADAETDRILDWREPGDARHPNGAGRGDYEAAGLPYAPRRRALPTVAELKLVMGITPELFAALQPAATVVSQQPGVDAAVAPRAALLALPDIDGESADDILRARHASGQGEAEPAAAAVRDLSGHAFTISTAVVQGRFSVRRVAVIRLSGDMQSPIWVYSWN